MTGNSDLVPKAGYNTLIEENKVGIYEITGEEFSYVNQRFADILGYQRKELVGTSPASVVAGEDCQSLQEDIESLVQGNVDSISTECTAVRSGGDEVVVKAHVTAIEQEPTPIFLGFIEDVTERKKQERRFKAIFNNTFQFTGLLEPDGTVLEANETALYFGGVDRDDIVGKQVWETYWFQTGTETRKTARKAVEQAQNGEFYRDEMRVQGNDEEVVIDFSVQPVTNEVGEVSQLIAEGRNITERKEREQKRQQIIDRVTDAVVEVDENWEFTLVDNRAEEIYGMSEGELLGQNFWDVFTASRDTRFEEVYQEVMKTREPATLEEYNPDLEGWFHVEVYPQSDNGLAFYFQNVTEKKLSEERTVGLNNVLSKCLKVTSKQDVCEILANAGGGRLHLPVLAVGFLDEGGIRCVAQSEYVRNYLDETELFGGDSGTAWTVYSNSESAVIENPPSDVFRLSSVDELFVHPLGKHGVLVTGSPAPNEEFIRSVAENVRMIFDRIDREKQLRSRDELLEDQNKSLKRLNRINDVIRWIDQALVSASTRTEIEQAVCDHLTSSETYSFAWIGAYDPPTNTIHPQDWAGHHQGYLDTVSFSSDSSHSEREPTGAAVRSREPTVVNELLDDPPHKPWQEAALKRGYRSVIAVPLLYQKSLYGTLTVYSDQSNHIDDMERQVLSELGETVAHAINAVESKRALVSDTVVDLELAITTADHPLMEFVEQDSDRKFEFESIVPSENEIYRVYYFVHGVSPDEFFSFVEPSPEIRDTHLITEHDERCLFESTLTEESLLFWLIDRGAVPRSFEITREEGRLRVELAGDIAIREFVELFKAEYPSTELIASRKREREQLSHRAFKSQVKEHLTARQQEVLQTAYFSGYFETPRERTGKELADSLDVSAPTVSDHIRAGLRNLFELLYDDDDTT